MPPRRAVTGRSQEPRRRYVEELRLLRAEKGDSLRHTRRGPGLGLVAVRQDGERPDARRPGGRPGTGPVLRDGSTATDAVGVGGGDPTQFKERYRRFMALEAKAAGIQQYSPAVVPGLLQTETYAYRLLFRGGLVPGAELDQQVEARMYRRKVLSGPEAPEFRRSSTRLCCAGGCWTAPNGRSS